MYNPAKPNMERLTKLAAMLADEAREEDATRPITAAVAFPELSTYLGYIDCMDVVGYNYKEEFYERDHARFPQKPFFGSENSYTLEAWKAVRDSKNIFGQFIWTGADFFGETVLWPMHGSSAGHITTAGFEKPQFYFRRGLWAEGETAGLVTARAPAKEKEQYEFFRSWNYVPGEPVEIRCYSSAGAPRVTLNGRELPMEDCTSDLGAYRCEIPFEAGELRAVVGRAEDVLCTTGAPVALRLTVVDDLCAGGDVCQVEVEVVDGEGRLVPDAGDRLHIVVEGAAELIAADNGDLYDPTDCQSPVRRAHQGRMLLTIRSLGRARRRHGDGFRRKPAPAGRHHRSEISAAPPLGRGGAEKEELSARRGELLFVCLKEHLLFAGGISQRELAHAFALLNGGGKRQGERRAVSRPKADPA